MKEISVSKFQANSELDQHIALHCITCNAILHESESNFHSCQNHNIQAVISKSMLQQIHMNFSKYFEILRFRNLKTDWVYSSSSAYFIAQEKD